MFHKINLNFLFKPSMKHLMLLPLIVLLMISPLAFAENRPGFVCGKFNDHVMEVPKSYIIYWAEYEGASAWDPNFVNNKKGCDANFVVLPMIASWPDMQPGDQDLWYKKKDEFGGLTISVEPLKRPDKYINYMRDYYLEKRKDKVFHPMVFIESLDLYFLKITRGLIRPVLKNKNSPYWFDKYINGYYWQEVDGNVLVVFNCMWLPLEKRYYICKAHFVMSEIGSLIEVVFTADDLSQWRSIVSNTQKFLLSHIKHKG